MSDDSRRATTELYQQVILDHNRSPRNWGTVDGQTHHADGDNPLCGDRYTVTARVNDDGVVEAIAVSGAGCAISKASASMMTEAIIGKSVAEAQELFDEFHRMVTGELDPSKDQHHLGKLQVFTGISEFPARVKCATLTWHTLQSALHGQELASTE